ncbi:MAG: hypothetical protein FWD69_08655 [Polyangiaceae bacterium]|nr:hypothetical protein [Polyangiaceae bacterium]
MIEDSQDPFPPELTALLELECRSHPPDPKLKAEVFDRVETAIALAGSAGGGGGPAVPDATPHAMKAMKVGVSVGAKKLIGVGLAALAVGGAAGSASTAVLLQRSENPVATPVLAASHPPPSAPIIEIAASAPSTGGSSVTALPPPVPVASRTTAPASSAARGDLAKERELLDVARAALARGRPADAIAAANEHARRWPRGYLEEEREVVLIQALAAAGKHQEVAAKAARFRRTFPASMLMPAVDAALDGSP